ncbi:glycosyltransferase [Cryobacterium melibiosiphilum]|uniref:D-inositol 3-phosphate glycosyltransferase n=1 Tax=Cryobacterium melibiosiphilum TaxID=995039 RepID=A0A3A5MQA5_9MICO|nr:glycosyltransferase family 4 protein [Cryobacterium melibiosiphilum]RJT92287.1 glycosyltransferase [Cryobacterium melibiosiphilum]
MTLRILLVIDYKLEYMGGAQTAFLQQARALAATGHTVTIAAPDACSQLDLAAAGVTCWDSPVTFVVPGANLPIVGNTARTQAVVNRRLAEWQTDLVITHSEFGLAAAVLKVAAKRGIPSMHVVHTFFWRGPRIAALAAPLVTAVHGWTTGLAPSRRRLAPRRLDSALRGMTLSVAQAADLVISPSHHQASALRAAGLHNVTVISNTSENLHSRPLISSSTGPLRLVWAARFAPEKRLDVALSAMTIVEGILGHGVVQLDIAGGRASREAPASVIFHGRISSAGVTQLLDSAHAAVITSNGFDNQPMIAIEAFKAGRPVIVSDPTLATEFGIAAIAASDTTAEGLARTIIRLAGDRDRLRAPAAGANRFSAQASAQQHACNIGQAFLRIDSVNTSSHKYAERFISRGRTQPVEHRQGNLPPSAIAPKHGDQISEKVPTSSLSSV